MIRLLYIYGLDDNVRDFQTMTSHLTMAMVYVLIGWSINGPSLDSFLSKSNEFVRNMRMMDMDISPVPDSRVDYTSIDKVTKQGHKSDTSDVRISVSYKPW